MAQTYSDLEKLADENTAGQNISTYDAFIRGYQMAASAPPQGIEWREECERLAKLVDFWQGMYNDLNNRTFKDLPGFGSHKIDNL